jgi:PAS domain S-box-containing protein
MEKGLTERSNVELLKRIEELNFRLRESEETLEAIKNGEVDAIIVSGHNGEKVFSLSSAETPYRIILEEMSEGAVITKADGTILYCNERLKYFTGSSPVIGHNILNFVSEAEKPNLLKLIKNGFEERISGIISILDPQKNTLYLNFSLRPLPSNFDGDICIIISDITKMKEYQNHLHELVNERTDELENANKLLKDLIATKNKFFNIIAHDLSSPFTGLIGVTEYLSENFNGLNQDEIKTMITILKDSSKSAYSLLQNLLDWSRSQTGQLSIRPERIELGKLIDDIIQTVFQNSSDKEIEVHSRISNNTSIFTDRNILNTILRNLLNNAIKFTPRRGSIVISATNDELNYSISVKDTGIGISKENIHNLFKLDTTNSRLGTEQEKGTGLGLKLCKEFVEKLNGNLTVESIENIGSEFVISIPILVG